jgi:hypothetical protein
MRLESHIGELHCNPCMSVLQMWLPYTMASIQSKFHVFQCLLFLWKETVKLYVYIHQTGLSIGLRFK